MSEDAEVDKKFFDVCLAALFHDIGKLKYRCLSETELIPTRRGERPTHEILGKRMLNETIGNVYSDFIGYMQGSSGDIYNIIVELGDWISAQEREEQEERPEVRHTGLQCTFSTLNIENKTVEKHVWKPTTLSLEEKDLIPVKAEKVEFSKELLEHFEGELKNIANDFEKLKNTSGPDVRDKRKLILRKILDILKKYTIFIPSASYYTRPDIDLYSHSKISCALASSMFKYISETNDVGTIRKIREKMKEMFDKKQKDDEIIDKDDVLNKEIFLLVKGDFSGIQNFISTLSTDNAIRHLKVRSFYLNYLNRLLARYIVDALDLSEANIIFSSGGNFEILAPNTESVLKNLEKLSSEINNFFFKNYGITLYLSIRVWKLSPLDFQRARFIEKIQNEEASIDISSKHRKFKEVNEVFRPRDVRGICKICHSNMTENGDKCEVCKNIEVFRENIKQWQKKGTININDLKESRLFDKKWLHTIGYTENIEKCENIFDFYAFGIPLEDDGRIIEVSKLSEKAEEETGYGKLGALKVDLDNLGRIFKEGLKNPTLSTYSRLSFDISLFFDGFLNTLVKSYNNKIYLIYSGGDDLFAIGPWHVLLDFCKDLAIIFRKYSCNHEKITLSAAFGFYGHKYPIKKIFEELDEKIDISKSLEGKNGITIFEFPIKFYVPNELRELNLTECNVDVDKEFNKVYEIIKTLNKEKRSQSEFELYFRLSLLLAKLVKENKISRGFLERLIVATDDLPERISLDNVVSVRPKWIIDYYLRRAKKEDNERIIDNLLKLWGDVYFKYLDGEFILPIFRMAAKTAQLYTKESKKEV
jgi:CRISPR-associated protein Csm1